MTGIPSDSGQAGVPKDIGEKKRKSGISESDKDRLVGKVELMIGEWDREETDELASDFARRIVAVLLQEVHE
jgi:hypothetical protein